MNIHGYLEQIFVEKIMQRNHFGFFQNQVVAVEIGIVAVAAFVLLSTIGIYLRNQCKINFVKKIAVFWFQQFGGQK